MVDSQLPEGVSRDKLLSYGWHESFPGIFEHSKHPGHKMFTNKDGVAHQHPGENSKEFRPHQGLDVHLKSFHQGEV